MLTIYSLFITAHAISPLAGQAALRHNPSYPETEPGLSISAFDQSSVV